MKLIQTLCCSALSNPFYPMVEVPSTQYPFSMRLLRLLAGFMAGGTIAQAISCITPYFLMEDPQAASMMSDLLMQYLSYYFLGGAFIVLSLSNILIKRGIFRLRVIRVPSLVLITCVAVTSFLLIPRMDYLRETALQDGLPVMQSPFANYFLMLNSLALLLMCAQIFFSTLMAWHLSNIKSPEASTDLSY